MYKNSCLYTHTNTSRDQHSNRPFSGITGTCTHTRTHSHTHAESSTSSHSIHIRLLEKGLKQICFAFCLEQIVPTFQLETGVQAKQTTENQSAWSTNKNHNNFSHIYSRPHIRTPPPPPHTHTHTHTHTQNPTISSYAIALPCPLCEATLSLQTHTW